MPVNSLDHYTIRTADVDESVKFYVEALGLVQGARPAFDFPGAWLYCGERPVVHLVGGARRADPGTGMIDHVAFRASGLRDITRRLRDRGIPFEERDVPGMSLRQLFLEDPDGVVIELNFPGDGSS